MDTMIKKVRFLNHFKFLVTIFHLELFPDQAAQTFRLKLLKSEFSTAVETHYINSRFMERFPSNCEEFHEALTKKRRHLGT